MPHTPPDTIPPDETPANRSVRAQALARAHWRVAVSILTINGALYGALILLIANNNQFLGRLLAPGLSLGIVFGTAVTIMAWLLTLVYVRWANTADHAPGRS
jgi:uncharacterized membrane protein (DUF485 family)